MPQRWIIAEGLPLWPAKVLKSFDHANPCWDRQSRPSHNHNKQRPFSRSPEADHRAVEQNARVEKGLKAAAARAIYVLVALSALYQGQHACTHEQRDPELAYPGR